MDRTDCAYLINTTPKYFYLLPLHLALLERYAPTLAWPVYIATEAEVLPPLRHPNLKIIKLQQSQEGFLESREAAIAALPESIKYVLPMQEDFLLEGRPMAKEIAEAFEALETEALETETEVLSVRLMPCPGPKGPGLYSPSPKGPGLYSPSPKGDTYFNEFKVLDFAIDSLVFTYQATIWKRAPYQTFMKTLLHKLQGKTQAQKNHMAIKVNIAENSEGQGILKNLFQGIHISIIRHYAHPNAVYLSPWPYRPTAVVRGVLEPWAYDLGEREGFPLNPR